jgi:hypothetical protein
MKRFQILKIKNDRSTQSIDSEALEGRLSTGRIPYKNKICTIFLKFETLILGLLYFKAILIASPVNL